ncbi:type IV pilus assembly protein PilE [Singulisphaera sp. GP187]|uniref:type IV pilin protein n=1 Tax=Singulisphaera sp. GP187 TaxID=1882752 RepID=UPI00092BCE59|nr:type IV pilin protein [Singulisphaera sp. GP187]SIO12586.1 type IV pilus assembly protein PilE [Singulisphaera sp. GP187]
MTVAGIRRPRGTQRREADGPAGSRGFSLLEVMVVVTIMGVFAAIAAPSFRRAVERSHADMAAANLQTVWVAQRFYRLDHGNYAPDLATLEAAQLVEPTVRMASTPYTYAILSTEASTFTATATRVGSNVWSGTLTLDQDGQIAGVINEQGIPTIAPGYLFTKG